MRSPPAQHPPNPAPQPPAGPPPHAHWQRGVHAFPLVPQCSNNARFVHLTTKGGLTSWVYLGCASSLHALSSASYLALV